MTRYTTAWNYDFVYYHRWYYRETLDEIRQRYWSHLKAQRREAAFPAHQMPRRVCLVSNIPNIWHSTLGPGGIARVRFQRKRRQIVKTHLRSVFP